MVYHTTPESLVPPSKELPYRRALRDTDHLYQPATFTDTSWNSLTTTCSRISGIILFTGTVLIDPSCGQNCLWTSAQQGDPTRLTTIIAQHYPSRIRFEAPTESRDSVEITLHLGIAGSYNPLRHTSNPLRWRDGHNSWPLNDNIKHLTTAILPTLTLCNESLDGFVTLPSNARLWGGQKGAHLIRFSRLVY